MVALDAFSFLTKLEGETDEVYRLRIEARGTEMINGINCSAEDRLLVIALQMCQLPIALYEVSQQPKSGCYGVSYEGKLASLPFANYQLFCHESAITEEEFDLRDTDYASFIDKVYFRNLMLGTFHDMQIEALRMLREKDQALILPTEFGVTCKGYSELTLSAAVSRSLKDRKVVHPL